MALQTLTYNIADAVSYAHRWADARNPAYYDFDKLGGDCTNFVSQCIFAGAKIMNYSKTPWYYSRGYDKSPSWSGVTFLHDFLVGNTAGPGPFAQETEMTEILPGDVIQMLFQGKVYQHSLFVVQVGTPPAPDSILVATHTDDGDNRPLTEYDYAQIRFLHILGVHQWI